MHLLLKSDWSIVLIMTGAVKQIVEEGRILVTVHHIFSTNNGMQNLISALKTSQPNGFTAAQLIDIMGVHSKHEREWDKCRQISSPN